MHNKTFKNLNKLKGQSIWILADKQKRPINHKNGTLININDKINLTDYKTVLVAFKKIENAKFIGIVLGDNDYGNLACIDIDNCIKNGVINKEAKEIIDAFNSYTELSQSGNGIHIFFFANKNTGKCKKSGLNFCSSLEIYDKSNRYMIFADNAVVNHDIVIRQAECNIFLQKYFCKAINANDRLNTFKTYNIDEIINKDKKLKNLYYGTRQFQDESANDFALISKLVFWLGNNKERIKGAFLKSPFVASKDTVHKQKILRADYIERSIENCLNGGFYGKL